MGIRWVIVAVMFWTTLVVGTDAAGYQLKKGILLASETWDQPTVLVGDVVVPEGVTLTLMPGAVVILNSHDELNLGADASTSELIVKGKVIAKDQDVEVLSVHDSKVASYLNASYQTVEAEPSNEAEVASSLKGFKHQYKVLWAIALAIRFVFS